LSASEGANDVIVYSNDDVNLSNNSVSVQVYFNVDTTAPFLVVASPQNTTYNTINVSLNYTTDGSTCFYDLNAAGNTTLSSCENSTLTGIEGQNNVTVYANDAVNNSNSTQVYYTIDTITPSLTVAQPQNITYNFNTSLPLNFTTDGTNCSYALDDAEFGNVSIPSCTNTTFGVNLTEGAHNITVYANDNATNSNSSVVYFSVDTLAPNITVDSPLNITYNYTVGANRSVDLNVSANEAVSAWSYDLNGAGNVTFIPNTTIAVAQRDNCVTVYGNDTADNWGSDTQCWTANVIPWGLNVTAPANGSTNTTNPVNFSWTAFDDYALQNCSGITNDSAAYSTLNTSDVVNGTNFLNITFGSNGAKAVGWRCFDTDGLENTSANITIIINVSSAFPEVTLWLPPDGNWTNSTNVSFTVSATDDVALSNLSVYTNSSGWSACAFQASPSNNTNYTLFCTLTDGSYLWNANATDNESQSNFSLSNRTVNVDTTPPNNIQNQSPTPPNGSTINVSFAVLNFTFNETNINNCTYSVNGTPANGTVNDSYCYYNWTSLANNTNYSFNLTVYDLALNSNSSLGWNFTTLLPAPTCDDGTPLGECSTTLPLYCEPSNVSLVNNASTCGCNPGQVVNATECVERQTGRGQGFNLYFIIVLIAIGSLLLLFGWLSDNAFVLFAGGCFLLVASLGTLSQGVDVPSGGFSNVNSTFSWLNDSVFENRTLENGTVIDFVNSTIPKQVVDETVEEYTFTFERYEDDWSRIFGVVLALLGLACFYLAVSAFLFGRDSVGDEDY